MSNGNGGITVNFGDLIKQFNTVQTQVMAQVQNLAANFSKTNPGQFMLLQFTMSKLTQVGDSISNLIATFNSGINSMIRNQRAQ